jgi:RNA recognition motif-containing protein
MSKQLYITNLSSDTTESELNLLFAQVGTVVSMQISTDPHTGAHKSYGWVEMATLELAQAAVRSVNNYLLHNRKIQVKELRSTQQKEEQVPSRAGQRSARKASKKSS